jgi:hypothetical protein
MTEERRPSSLGMTFLVGGVLLLSLTGLVIAFLPTVACSPGWIEGGAGTAVTSRTCPYCKGTGRITFLKHLSLYLNVRSRGASR